jgi:hypothetical protein
VSSGLLDSITQGLVPKQIGIHEFVESSEYCDKFAYPRQIVLLKLMFLEEMTGPEEDILSEWMNGGSYNQVLISPNIRERRDYLRERGYKHFREVNLVGGRRSSKGWTTGMAMAKVMWDTLNMGDPHGVYGIDRGKEIYFSCVAASEGQAKEFQYSDLVSTVEGCKSFDPYLQKSLETEFRVATPDDLKSIAAAKARGGKIQRDIAKLRGKALAANAGTLRGSATMCITIDEMAHMTVGESKASAEAVYTAAVPSLNQFGLDGMMFLNSSPYTKVGKFYEIFEIGMRKFDPTAARFAAPGEVSDQSDPRMFTFEFPSWALFEGYRKYKSRWKQRERGKEFGKMITVSPDWDPEALDADGEPLYSNDDKEGILSQRNEEAKNPEAFKVEQRGLFAEVIDAYLNPTMVDRMYAGLPVGHEPLDEGGFRVIPQAYYSNHGGNVPPGFRYKFHVDPSSTTAGFGFAIAHLEYFLDPNTGNQVEHVVFDLIKRWDPKAFGGVIRWGPIRQEIVTYASLFRPFEITFDQHQSLEPIQLIQEQLTNRSIICQVYEKTATNELNWKRWEVFKTACYQGLVHAPCDEQVNLSPWGGNGFTSADELKFLQQLPTGGKFPKIEKQEIGPVRTKDMADCVAECTYALIGNLMSTRMRERLGGGGALGGHGGYGIGQGGPIGGPGPPGISGYYSSAQEKARSGRITPGRGDFNHANLSRGAVGGRGRFRSRRGR